MLGDLLIDAKKVPSTPICIQINKRGSKKSRVTIHSESRGKSFPVRGTRTIELLFSKKTKVSNRGNKINGVTM